MDLRWHHQIAMIASVKGHLNPDLLSLSFPRQHCITGLVGCDFSFMWRVLFMQNDSNSKKSITIWLSFKNLNKRHTLSYMTTWRTCRWWPGTQSTGFLDISGLWMPPPSPMLRNDSRRNPGYLLYTSTGSPSLSEKICDERNKNYLSLPDFVPWLTISNVVSYLSTLDSMPETGQLMLAFTMCIV